MTIPLSPRQRWVVRAPSWLGDAVAAEPVLRAFDEHFRAAGCGAHLTFALPARLQPLFREAFPGVTWLETDGAGARAAAWRGFDGALLLTGSFRSAWLVWRAGVPLRVGWSRDARGWLLTHAPRPAREVGRPALGEGRRGRWPRHLPRPFGASAIELAHLVGVPVRQTRPRLAPTAEAVERAAARLRALGLEPGGPWILCNVGARPESAKAVPAELWAGVLSGAWRALGWPMLAACAPGEEASVRDARAALLRRDSDAARALHACDAHPVGLAELVALSARARVVVGGDSGPRHVAAAVGAPVVAVAGPTDVRHSADLLERQRVLQSAVDCGPCHRERCPLSGASEHACMRSVEPERVVAALLELLALSS